MLWRVMEKSLEFDYFEPLVWNERNGCLVSGHLRFKVLVSMGFTRIEVIVVDYSEEIHYARMIAANRLLGEWEEAVLASLAGEIETAGIDAALAGFDHKAMMALLSAPPVEDDSESAEELVSKADLLQRKWRVEPGDLYQIDRHRLFCGDCTKRESWNTLLNGQLADAYSTDPPYNIAYDAAHGDAKKAPRTILNDDMSADHYASFLTQAFSAAFANLKPGGVFYIAHAETTSFEVRQAMRDVGFMLKQTLIWEKPHFTLGRQDYQWQHEPIFYGWKPGAGHYWQGGYRQATMLNSSASNLKKLKKKELIEIINDLHNAKEGTVVRAPKGTDSSLHPTIKPLPLIARLVWNSTKRGEIVSESFSGSGTTLVAAHVTDRRGVAIELDPKFVAVGLERLSQHGLQPEKLNG